MFENIGNFFKRMVKTTDQKELGSKDAAKERLHLVLMQDRANVSADFLELMKQEIIDVIKKYIIVDESAIDVRLTNQSNDDGTNGAPALYANIPIINIKNDMKADKIKEFDGVNFNKENSQILKEENNKEQKSKNEKINEINKESIQEKNDVPEKRSETKKDLHEEFKETKNNASNDSDKRNKIENKKTENQNIDVNNEEKFDEDDEEEDDDDVTFDDLLKAAEEDDKKQKIKEKNKK